MRIHSAKIVRRHTAHSNPLTLRRRLLQDCPKTTRMPWTGPNRRVSRVLWIMKSSYPPRCSLCSNICVKKPYEVRHRKVAHLMILCHHHDPQVCTSLHSQTCATNEVGKKRLISNIWTRLFPKSLIPRPPTSVEPGHFRSKDSPDSAHQCATRDADVAATRIGASLTSACLRLQIPSEPFRSHSQVLIRAAPFVRIHLVERDAQGGSG